jgi:hypothetical protein
MGKRLLLLCLLIALVGGVVSGTPLHSPNSKMMKCCDKAKSADRSPAANATRLCCAVNCTESIPAPSGVSISFTPSTSAIANSIEDQIAALFSKGTEQFSTTPQYSRKPISRTSQPKFIQHHSLLI